MYRLSIYDSKKDINMLVKRLVIAACILLIAAAVSAAGYFGYTWFNANYIVLNQDDAARLVMQVQQYAAQAYSAGLDACRKTI